ncbi:MAG: hypothetical protein WCV62_05975 [Candidatus Peribacteraceae bacterium]|jgi:hypothetical protein
MGDAISIVFIVMIAMWLGFNLGVMVGEKHERNRTRLMVGGVEPPIDSKKG